MNTKLACNLKLLRQQRHFNQAALATNMNVSRQTISSWETGRNTPDIESLMQLAHFYHVSLDHLVSGNLDFHQPDKLLSSTTLGILFAVLFTERITVDAPIAARIWIDYLMWFPVVLAGIMFIINKFQAIAITKFVYLGGLGAFSFIAIISSVTNLFYMGFQFQTVCFICGLIALVGLLFSVFKNIRLARHLATR